MIREAKSMLRALLSNSQVQCCGQFAIAKDVSRVFCRSNFGALVDECSSK